MLPSSFPRPEVSTEPRAIQSIIDSRGSRNRGEAGSFQSLGNQRAYSHVERERAKIASEAEINGHEEARLIAALRDVTSGGAFGV